jgi:hypothetical protein
MVLSSSRAQKEPRELRAPLLLQKETREPLVLLVLLVLLAPKGLLALLALLVLLEQKVLLELLVPPGQRETKALKALPALMETKDKKD